MTPYCGLLFPSALIVPSNFHCLFVNRCDIALPEGGHTILTHIHGCLRASEAVIRFAGFTVNMLFMRFFASGVTVSHSGEGY